MCTATVVLPRRWGQTDAALFLFSAAQESSADAGAIAALTDAPTWIVDPVDGTTNFVHGFPMTCVSIGFGRGKKVSQGPRHVWRRVLVKIWCCVFFFTIDEG